MREARNWDRAERLLLEVEKKESNWRRREGISSIPLKREKHMRVSL